MNDLSLSKVKTRLADLVTWSEYDDLKNNWSVNEDINYFILRVLGNPKIIRKFRVVSPKKGVMW